MKIKFLDIAIDIPVHTIFTYRVPDYIESVSAGMRVLVPFGNKVTTGVVLRVKNEYAGDFSKLKNIKSLLDEEKIVSDELLKTILWMSSYYLSPVGELVFSVFPRGTNVLSEKSYELTENSANQFDKIKTNDNFVETVYNLFTSKKNVKLTKKQINKKLQIKTAEKYINRLSEYGIITESGLFNKQTKAKIVKIISKNFRDFDEEKFKKEYGIRTQKQLSVLQTIDSIDKYELSELVKKSGAPYSTVNSLIAKGLLTETEERVMRESEDIFTEEKKDIELNQEQKECLKELKDAISEEKFKSFLLFGVTGSGKTEVYINIIREVIGRGKQAIVLVPEISLTPQLIHRFRNNFGNIIGVIHSRLTEGEKFDTFTRINNSEYKIIIGARSAIFAPVKNLGIVIVDEEHDSSYKQESSPRYNGRDAAIVRANYANALVLLGSATPSIESYYNAKSGKYKLLTLTKRATDIVMPEIRIIDTTRRRLADLEKDRREFFIENLNQSKAKFLSRELIMEIDEKLKLKEGIILLQNRRGYHSYIECIDCDSVEMCNNCSIAMTFHKALNLLKCHYCGSTKQNIKKCSQCGSLRIIPMGAGTEKVEEELINIFPNAIIERLDSDSITSRVRYQTILKNFYDGNIDILVGTQIISKGLDFPNVTLVGVINSDIGLLNPDFRATEKTYQILTQVAGRSGRAEKKGEVLIQTNHPDYFVFDDVLKHDYDRFYEKEIKIRNDVGYPPFYRLVLVEVNSKDRNLAESKIKEIFNLIAVIDKNKLIKYTHPIQPLFSKLKNSYRWHLIIKIQKSSDVNGVYINGITNKIQSYASKNFPSKVRFIIDVDPVNLM